MQPMRNHIMEWRSLPLFLLPQANGLTYPDFGCTHPIDGLFWSLPIYLLGFFSKYECWVADLIMGEGFFYKVCVWCEEWTVYFETDYTFSLLKQQERKAYN